MKKKSLSNILLRNKKCLLLSGIYAPHTPQSASAASRPTHTQTPAGRISKCARARTPVKQ